MVVRSGEVFQLYYERNELLLLFMHQVADVASLLIDILMRPAVFGEGGFLEDCF